MILILLVQSCLCYAQSGWYRQDSNVDSSKIIFSTFFLHVDTGFAVGDDGTIIRTYDGGENWTQLTSGTTNRLTSIYFTDSDTGYVGGWMGTFLKTTDGGDNWNSLPYSGNQWISSIFFLNPDTGHAVSTLNNKSIKTTDGGNTWVEINHSSIYNMMSLNFTDIYTGYAVGGSLYNSSIIKTTDGGGSWSTYPTDFGHGLYSVHFVNDSTGYAVGEEGLIVNTVDSGNTWNTINAGTDDALFSVFFITPDTGYVAGENGVILKTFDGGDNWTHQSSGTMSRIRSMVIIDTVGYAVGHEGTVITTNLTDSQTYLTLTEINLCLGDSIFLENEYQSEYGIYYDSLHSVNQNDSIIRTTLFIRPIHSDSYNFSICQGDSVLIGNIYYADSISNIDSLQSVYGCDSIVSINISFNNNARDTSVNACESYSWNGYDYEVSGNYIDTLTNVNGCDSIVTLHLTITDCDFGIFPLVDSSKSWNILNRYTGTGYADTYALSVGEDTIIDGKLYNEINISYYSFDTVIYTTHLHTYIREDPLYRVYWRNSADTTDYLVYDFGASQGDTIDVYPIISDCTYPVIVDSVDYVHFADTTRKRIYVSNQSLGVNNIWYSGVGSYYGLFQEAQYSHYCDLIEFSELLCYKENDTIKHISPFYNSCYIMMVGIEDPNAVESLRIYPNPTNNVLNVEVSNKGTIILFDLMGKGVLRQDIYNNKVIDISEFESGMYLLLYDSGNSRVMRKITVLGN